MIPASFDYLAPTSVAEALAALAEAGDDAKVLAGGRACCRSCGCVSTPRRRSSTSAGSGAPGGPEDGDHIVIGAMTTYADVLASDLVRQHAGLLTNAIAEVADPQIRHRGTVGGALVHADPAGDVGAPVLALGAEFVIAGSGGQPAPSRRTTSSRTSSTRRSGRTSCSPRSGSRSTPAGAALREVRPGQPPVVDRRGRRNRPHRGRLDRRGADGAHQHGLDPVARQGRRGGPRRQGRDRRGGAGRRAAAAEGTNPPSDLNGNSDYRKHLATVLTRRAVLAAAGALSPWS